MTDETPVGLRGWFAEPDVTDEVDLGPCRCPGTPHDHDSATYRTQWGDAERKSIFYTGAAIRLQADGTVVTDGTFDPEATNTELMARGVVSWTLLDDKGKPVPITRRMLTLLSEKPRLALLTALQEADELFKGEPLPKASGARSPGSSPASASPNRAARRRK